MGYRSKLQVIERRDHNRQYYLICPAPLAQALELAQLSQLSTSEPVKCFGISRS